MNNKPEHGKYCVYIIETENGSYYTGCTNNLKRRYNEHSKGRGAKYTRMHKPARVLCSWYGLNNIGEALKVESYVKRQNRRVKELMVSKPQLLAEKYSNYSGKKIKLTHKSGLPE
jgi:putative endonuclease